MNHIGRCTELMAGGKRYTLSRFERRQLAGFLDWAEQVLPNPLDEIRNKLDGFPPHLQELMVRDAIQSARLRRSFHSPDVQALLQTPEGLMKILQLLLKEHHPDLTQRDAENLFDDCLREHGDAYLQERFARAMGVMESPEGPDDDSKKNHS